MKETIIQGRAGEKIKWKWLINLLYYPIDEISSLSSEQLNRIIGQYPIIGRVYDTMVGFKQTL